MTTEKTSSPRRSGADWFGLIAFAVLVICSAVLVVRLISTKFLPTGQLVLLRKVSVFHCGRVRCPAANGL